MIHASKDLYWTWINEHEVSMKKTDSTFRAECVHCSKGQARQFETPEQLQLMAAWTFGWFMTEPCKSDGMPAGSVLNRI